MPRRTLAEEKSACPARSVPHLIRFDRGGKIAGDGGSAIPRRLPGRHGSVPRLD